MKLKSKLIYAMLLLSVIPLLVVVLLTTNLATVSIEELAFHQLESVTDLKKMYIVNILQNLEHNNKLLAFKNPTINRLHTDLYKYFIESKTSHNGVYNVNTPAYRAIWKKHAPYFKEYLKLYNYHDFFVVSAQHGHVMFSVSKENDLGKNLKYSTGHKDWGLAKIWRKVTISKKFAISDFESYSPSKGAAAAFSGVPLFDNKKNMLAVIILQLSPDKINHVMQDRIGMGKTGSSYLIGMNNNGSTSLRNDRKIKDEKILRLKSDSIIKKCFLQQKRGYDFKIGSTGKKELVAYSPINLYGLKWSIFSTIEDQEILSSVKQMNTISFIIIAITFIIIVFCASIISKSIATKLNSIASNLSQASLQITNASTQIASSSQEVAGGANTQASSLEETSASLEEMSAMTDQNADNARQANIFTTESVNAIKSGKEMMQQTVQAVENIKNSSDKTATIIKTIDEIAFQTNLLALNAAIEAARAGDAGMGFAVVAEEVRSLAQRSTESAAETTALIEASKDSAQQGVDATNRLNSTINEIIESITKASQLVLEVATASKEQAGGIQQINHAIETLNKITQGNAASSEEAASASEELAAQANELTFLSSDLVAVINGKMRTNNTNSINSKSKFDSNVDVEKNYSVKKVKPLEIINENSSDKQKVISLEEEDLNDF